MLVGLTGGIGSGKSTVANLFANLGVPVISADEIAHQILKTNHAVFQTIIKHFGDEYVDQNLSIDRRKLRHKVFSSPADKLWLENLLHPLIREEILDRAHNVVYPYCIIEIPLLVESGWQDIVDRVLTVDCTEELQLSRTASRDSQDKEQVAHIIANQITRSERKAASNEVIENSGDLAHLKQHVEKLHHQYLELASY